MPTPTHSPLIFVSYSRADLMLVLRLVRLLRESGARTWVDVESLVPGQSWKDAIGAALAQADLFLLILSQKSLESVWTSVEITMAESHDLPIVPVMIDKLDIASLPPAIANRQILNLADTPFAALEGGIAQAICVQLGLAPPAAIPATTAGQHAWIDLRPPQPTADQDRWTRALDQTRPSDALRMRLPLPLDRPRIDDLLRELADMARATLVVPAGIPTADSAFLIAMIARTLGPGRFEIIAADPALAPFVTLAGARLRQVSNALP